MTVYSLLRAVVGGCLRDGDFLSRGGGLTRSSRDTASLNSNGIGGIFFLRGIFQSNTLIARETATSVATADDCREAHAISAHVSGVRAPFERPLWFSICQALAFRRSDEHSSANAVSHCAGVIAKRELVNVTPQMALADVVK